MNVLFSLEDVKFGGDGLVPVIVQDVLSGEVLMMAWANREALEATLSSGMLTFWSRSRNELWKKGETSGNTLSLQELRLDCDGDALLALAEPAGPEGHLRHSPACEGRGTFPGVLWRYLEKRRHDAPAESYTARLLSKGLRRVAQKVGEEGVETALAVAAGDRKETVCEAADLLYHLEAALLASGVSPRDVYAELERRHTAPSPQGQTTDRPS